MHRTPAGVAVALVLSLALASLTACGEDGPVDHFVQGVEDGLRGERSRIQNGSFIADLDGVEIHYEVHGEGPVLMALPNSWGLSLEGLRALYRPLEEHLTLVYFDPRGIGESGPVEEDADMGLEAVREDFDALRRHLGLERVHAIGWSNGATNLIFLASERPEILRSAIFVHTAPRFSDQDMTSFAAENPELFEELAPLQARLQNPEVPAEEKEEVQRRLILEGWFPHLFADVEEGRRLLPEIYRDVELSHRHMVHSQAELPTFDLTDRLADIPVRSLVVAGAHDWVAPERVEELARGLPEADFVLFDDSGHFAPVEEREEFVAAVLRFLDVEE